MYKMACVVALVALCAGLAHSFSWDIVRGVDNRLEFVDINGTILHTENVTSDKIHEITYDPVHKRVLLADANTIFSFDITTKKREHLISTKNLAVSSMAYDPATELLVWVEDISKMYTVTLKPNSDKNEVNEKQLIFSDDFNYISEIAVDSCGGSTFLIKKVPLNGSVKEVVVDNGLNYIHSFAIDQQAQQIYFTDNVPSIKSADLNGNNTRTILALEKKGYSLTVSNDFMYWLSLIENHTYYTLMQIPNPQRGIDVKPKPFIERVETGWWYMAAYININDIIPQEIQNCDNLKSLLPNNSVSTDVSLFCVYGTKVDGESRCECTQGYSGERCEVSECHNYCLYGNCSTSADGQPKCSCYAGYSGDRCEVNSCQGYCLNGGLCSLSEEGKPLCRCTGHYEGERCDVPVFPTKCFQVSTDVSLLCVHGTKVDGESRCECTQGYSGKRCEISECHNYCLYGNCSTSADGQPKCSCYAGYSGDRCEVNSCQGYCLNGGLCSLSEEGKPLCRCTGHYEGERCDVHVFQTKCFQVISLLKDMFNIDVTSPKAVTSTDAPTQPPHSLQQEQQQQQDVNATQAQAVPQPCSCKQ